MNKATVSKSIQYRFLILFILLNGLLILVQFLFSYHSTNKLLFENINRSISSVTDLMRGNIDYRMQAVVHDIRLIADNEVIISAAEIITENPAQYNMQKPIVMNEVLKNVRNDCISNVYLFTPKAPPVNCYYDSPVFINTGAILDMFENVVPEYQNSTIFHNTGDRSFEATVYQYLQKDEKIVGLMLFKINDQLFQETFQQVQLSLNAEIFISNAQGDILYSNQSPSQDSSQDNMLVLSGELPNSDWELTCQVSKEELAMQSQPYNQFFFISTLILQVFILVIPLFIVHSVFKPMKDILVAMRNVQNGNLDVSIKEARGEFKVIADNFNYMIEYINKLITTIYKQQKDYRRAEMSALEAKLNPHFLYNTLNMIYWSLVVEGKEDLGHHIVMLSDILRYSISNDKKSVTIEEDFKQLENFLAIHALRFEGKLKYDIQIDASIRDCRIPKLLMQPIVENAIKYGFKEIQNDGFIILRAADYDKYIELYVIDNGVGITPERRDEVMEQMDQSDSPTIGLPLVNQLIRYTYGEDCGLSIDNRSCGGVVVTARIRKEMNVKIEEP